MDIQAEFKALNQFKSLSKDYRNRIKFFYVRCHSILQSTKHLQVKVCDTKFTLLKAQNELYNRNEKQTELMSDLSSRCILANHENTVWYDMNGCKLVHYFPHLISESLSNNILNEFRTLTTLYPPHAPGVQETTSRHQHYLDRKELLQPNTSCGVYRFTIHHQLGHQFDPPTFSKHFFSNNATHTFAAISFRQSEPLRQLSEFISIVFAGIDAQSWDKYRTAYVQASELFIPLQVIDRCPIQCFVGYYLLVNMLTTLHRDVLDPPDGWVAMIVLGNYENGELVLPDIGVALPYKARDVVFIRSWALKHFIREFQGNRYVLVFSTSSSIFEWLKMVY
jgi:hypothetical protein